MSVYANIYMYVHIHINWYVYQVYICKYWAYIIYMDLTLLFSLLGNFVKEVR